jgi:hypothetical protein
MIADNACDPGLTSRDHRNMRALRYVAIPWFVSFLAAHLFLPPSEDQIASVPTWVWPLMGIPIALGTLMAYYYYRFIQGADELVRKMHVEALAVGFGTAFVVGMVGDLFGQIGVPKLSTLTWVAMLVAFSIRLNISKRALRA